MRVTLLFIHVLIIIFLFVHTHPHRHLTTITEASHHQNKFAVNIFYIFTLIRILLYHSASIIAVWFSRQYGAGVVRASGVLLIGELVELTTGVLHQMTGSNPLQSGELYFLIALDFLFLIALLMTFRLAEKLSKHQRNFMQIELLAENSGRMGNNNLK